METEAAQHSITYFVNGERENTDEKVLTVRQILEGAGFSPATDYTLSSENPKVDYGTDYDRKIDVHPNQRFRALHRGPTPTS
jgi:hypothetical protein